MDKTEQERTHEYIYQFETRGIPGMLQPFQQQEPVAQFLEKAGRNLLEENPGHEHSKGKACYLAKPRCDFGKEIQEKQEKPCTGDQGAFEILAG